MPLLVVQVMLTAKATCLISHLRYHSFPHIKPLLTTSCIHSLHVRPQPPLSPVLPPLAHLTSLHKPPAELPARPGASRCNSHPEDGGGGGALTGPVRPEPCHRVAPE